MKPDFGRAASDYARHRAGFPESFFDRMASLDVGRPGERLVDLGTGTGTLARGFARRGCRVIGIDPSEPLLAQARVLDREAGVRVEYRVARAEETGLPAGCADVVTAGQCWHWFDGGAALREVIRILAPGGRLVIAYFDWIPLAGNLVEATERLIESHNPSWKLGGGTGLHPGWLRGLGESGFRGIETFSYDVDEPYSPEAWRGRIRASAGVGGTLPPEAVERFDRDLARLLSDRFPGALLAVPHRVFAILAHAPGRES